MNNFSKFLSFFLLPLIILFSLPSSLWAVSEKECEQRLQKSSTKEELDECINLWDQLYKEMGAQKQSLTAAIKRFDTSIAIATATILRTIQQIEVLEEEITSLSGKIERLEGSLTSVSEILLERIITTYKTGKVPVVYLLFSSDGFSDLLLRAKYIKIAQAHDKKLMIQMQTTKDNFSAQKKLREEKKEEQESLKSQLEAQKVTLAQQKEDKEYLLVVTKNNEKRYQELLAQARAELEAIIAILAGKGNCSEVGHISEGERIASVIQGSSCNSSGTHLHFMVTKDGTVQNPFNYLKAGVSHENCSGSSCGSGDGDAFNPSGEWNWPIDASIKFSQGYGSTWAVGHTWVGGVYSFHNGIDIKSSSSTVKAVKSGNLYQCAYVGGGGCGLPYVRLDHDDSNFETYYLHVNY